MGSSKGCSESSYGSWTCELSDFGAPDQKAVAKKYFDFFKAYTLADKEVIWAGCIDWM